MPRPPIVLFAKTTDRDTGTVADILRQETVGGAILLLAAGAALLWANVATGSYEAVRHLRLGPLDLQHWATDGVLTIFFFVAGLELKRELTVGALSRPAQALVPIVAALGGMALPALIFLAVNLTAATGAPQGWAIPMATDIAFALGILGLVGSRLPASLRAFLLTLAIVDDLGAIVVIAVVFTSDVRLAWLAGAAAVVALWGLLQWRRVPGGWYYLPLALACWWATWQSGIHPTIAGVAVGLLSRSSATDPAAPVNRWEHRWRPVSAGFAAPVFALFAAGVTLSVPSLAGLARDPVAIGIVAGLVVGKTLGILGGAYLAARFSRAELAPELRWAEVGSMSVVAGVGFTVALLIAELSFPGDPVRQEVAKTAVLIGSLLAALIGGVSLRRRMTARLSRDDPGVSGREM